MENFDYLIPELFRVTTPGRLCVIHCKDLPLFKGSNGVAGLRDFPGEIVRRFCGNSLERLTAQIDALVEVIDLIQDKAPVAAKIKVLEDELVAVQRDRWVFHSRVTIWKCPTIEMERTNNHGLLHNQLCKDSSVSRQGMADYLLVFRKWSPEMDGLNSIKPVNRGAKDWRFELLQQQPRALPASGERQELPAKELPIPKYFGMPKRIQIFPSSSPFKTLRVGKY